MKYPMKLQPAVLVVCTASARTSIGQSLAEELRANMLCVAASEPLRRLSGRPSLADDRTAQRRFVAMAYATGKFNLPVPYRPHPQEVT